MTLHNHPHQQWLPPGHLRPPDDHHDPFPINSHLRSISRPRTPQIGIRAATLNAQMGRDGESDVAPEEDPKMIVFKELYKQSEARVSALFGNDGETRKRSIAAEGGLMPRPEISAGDSQSAAATPAKKTARKLDDDDYDMDDDEDDEDATESNVSPLKNRSTGVTTVPPISSPARPGIPTAPPSDSSKDKSKTAEDVRKKHEEDKKALEDEARRSFHTLFYTLEDDRNAMLDQQKLEEIERQADAEASGPRSTNNANNQDSAHGSLASATNFGTSILSFKNLIGRIDQKRDQVQASDAELRSLMSEVRKNRSKWANEDKVGQEELYEALEKVLSELKAMTEHSSPFLVRVNKRDAPDYYTIIKHPMDLGTMTKKLKGMQYKSKQEFVEDVSLIWSNCLKYNGNPEHFLRRHALYMRKETDKLVPLIPEIVIRDRADVEREERQAQLAAEGDAEGGEDSDDDRPIMSSRGRMAPGKTTKKGTTSRKAPPGEASEGTPGAETKPGFGVNGSAVRSDSDLAMEGSQNGTATPPPGTMTPLGINGVFPPGSQGDSADADRFGASISNALAPHAQEIEYEDPEYKIWKQVTKKDRALLAAERHRLFKGDKLDPDAPALLRSKAGMRRWARNQKLPAAADGSESLNNPAQTGSKEAGETLAEGMEEGEDRMLPDYYDSLSAIPDITPRLRWVEDENGELVDHSEEGLRVLPSGSFCSPKSKLTERMEANMRQMQETRKICAKIGMVKQMQLQTQMYQNQFQKYDPVPFFEHGVPPHVMRDNGPVMNPWISRAALQRSICKIFYHAGFEETQPSALEAVTDIAVDYFRKIAETFSTYNNTPKIPVPIVNEGMIEWKPAFSMEEIILHTLDENGTDLESLEAYVKEDVERTGTKLGVVHARMKSHYAEMLRPALADAGPDGAGAFSDGSEQFVGGDFAEDLGEDFFGFKALGLDKELGMDTLGVPLHLLQHRLHHATAQNTGPASTMTSLFAAPQSFPAITVPLIKTQIGLVQNFFLAKLHANNDEPLVEDDDLPIKQRVAKPRLPANGKITSPLKRPTDSRPGAQSAGANAGSAKKKLKTTKTGSSVTGPGANETGTPDIKDLPNNIPASKVGPLSKPVGKLKLNVPRDSVSTANGLDGSTDIVKNSPSVNKMSAAGETPTTNGVTSSKLNGTATLNGEVDGEGGPVGEITMHDDDGGILLSPESINGNRD